MTRISVLDELGPRLRQRRPGPRPVHAAPPSCAMCCATPRSRSSPSRRSRSAILLAGAVIVETVFAWPGIGQLAMQSIQARDFLVVQAIVLFVSLTYIALNLLADLAYTIVDPRIRGAA